MTFKVAKAGVQKVIDLFKVRIGGAWKDVGFGRVWKVTGGVGAWKEFYTYTPGGAPPSTPTPPPIIVVTPPPPTTLQFPVGANPVNVAGNRQGTGVTYSEVAYMALPTNGTPPYAYSYMKETGDGVWSKDVNPADTRQIQFHKNITSVPAHVSATYKCTVTDTAGNVGTININVDLYTYKIGKFQDETGDL